MGNTNSSERWDQKSEEAQSFSDKAQSTIPDRSSFGFFAYSDAPVAIGGGFGAFFWFETYDEMLTYLIDHFIYLLPGPANSDPFAAGEEFRSSLENLSSSIANLEANLDELNQIIKGFQQIEWIGILDDLLQGDFPFGIRMRSEFCNQDDGTPEIAPISSDEIDDFVSFLGTCGV